MQKIIGIEDCWKCYFLDKETCSHCTLDEDINISADEETPPKNCPLRNGEIVFRLEDSNLNIDNRR